MAAPNLLNLVTVTGKSASLSLANTSATVLLDNPASSGKLLRVIGVYAANDDGTNSVDATLSVNSEANGGGTAFKLAHLVPVAARASVLLVGKDAPIYLEEDRSLVITASAGSDLDVMVIYEELS